MGKHKSQKKVSRDKLPEIKPSLQIVPVMELDDNFYDMVEQTFDRMQADIDITSKYSNVFMMQSLHGRAMSGFWGQPYNDIARQSDDHVIYSYPNCTMENIFEALGYDPFAIQYVRQDIVDSIKESACKAMMLVSDPACDAMQKDGLGYKLIDDKGNSYGGAELFYDIRIVDPLSYLRGMYLGSCMDSESWREKTENKYGIKYHRGTSKPVNLKSLKEHGLTLSDLSHLEPSMMIDLEELLKEGVISERDFELSSDGYTNAYIQLQKGKGISDDAALLSACLTIPNQDKEVRYNRDAGVGLFLMDEIDTLDKSLPVILNGGSDERLGIQLNEEYIKRFGEPLCSEEDILKVIWLSWSEGLPKASCSHRYFMQMDDKTQMTALESHFAWLDFATGGAAHMPQTMCLSFDRVESHLFYNTYLRRVRDAIRDGVEFAYKPIL